VPGRTLAIGDIHGCDVALETLLSNMQPTDDDTVVVLGDVVDRGPNTKRVIELLLELQTTCRLKLIAGNHEEMMLNALNRHDMFFWLNFGGHETMLSYGGPLDDIPPTHVDFLKAALTYYETEREIFVHAGLDPNVPLPQQTPDLLRWYKLDGSETPHSSGKRVVCGHTSQKSGMPIVGDGWVCIDTWVYGEGWLTCLDVGTDALYQARQTGQYHDGLTLADLAA